MKVRSRRWVLIGGLVVFVVIIAAAVPSIINHVRKPFSATATVAAGTTLRVEAEDADLTLHSGPDPEVHVNATGDYAYTQSPNTMTASTEGSTTTVTGSCKGACTMHLDITLPAGLAVQAHVAVGSITATASTGPLTAQIGTGNIEVSNPASAVDLHTNTGKVVVHDSRSDRLAVTTGTGEVRASFATSPTAVAVTTNIGEVDLNLPNPAAGYYIDAAARTGAQSISIPNDRYAHNTITVKTGTGSINIH
ncbi:DUF4097 family beta strand repeat-containing protein [Nocardia terpenica]|uniref:DUF4097 family beta strand repeat-containing protein n=1 Tax=Nocardia terpenica TaxID=455432 RepID=UPI0012FDC863|nr:DUF4097 family beta strand repeat-containing protein [Nocardia terpenica]